ncbi:hypothetical protein Hdeb2414_s0022g00615101 [Helianthus debilis subsp. tardiflorus]
MDTKCSSSQNPRSSCTTIKQVCCNAPTRTLFISKPNPLLPGLDLTDFVVQDSSNETVFFSYKFGSC